MSKQVRFNDTIHYFDMDSIAGQLLSTMAHTHLREPVYLRQATPQELEYYKLTKPIVVYPTKRPYLLELIRVQEHIRETNMV